MGRITKGGLTGMGTLGSVGAKACGTPGALTGGAFGLGLGLIYGAAEEASGTDWEGILGDIMDTLDALDGKK
jgi:hypothetical protein